jgi:hypothetical protein
MDENTSIPAVVLSDEIKEAYLKVFGNGGYETILSKIDNVNILKDQNNTDHLELAVGAGIITKAQAEILKEHQTTLEELYPIPSSNNIIINEETYTVDTK